MALTSRAWTHYPIKAFQPPVFSFMRHRFRVWDAATVEAMASFPLHRFDTPPVAFVPMRSASRERFVAAVEADGNVSCISPSIHTIHSATRLFDDDAQEEAILSGVAVHDAELCLVLWNAASHQYTAHFLKAQHTKMIPIGAAPLAAPDPSSCLCGVVHLGAAVCAVWSEGDVHYYTPPKNADRGLVLSRTYKLSGFDFLAMKRRAGTEDLQKLAGGLSVCSNLNTPGLVCIVGPQLETLKLKYVVLDIVAGVVRESGILDQTGAMDAPLRMTPDFSATGVFHLFAGEEESGVHRMKMTPTTLATRIGIKCGSRKRKMSETTEMHEDAENTVEQDATLQHPQWAELLTAPETHKKTRLTSRALKKICHAQQEINGKISSEPQSFDRRVAACVKSLQEALETQQYRASLADEVVNLLNEWKEKGTVLLLDLPGIAAEWMGTCGHDWSSLRKLLSLAPPRALASCAQLPDILLEAHQFDLLAILLADVQEMRSDQLSCLLQGILHHRTKAEGLAAQVNALDRIQSSINHALKAAERVEDVSADTYERLKWRTAVVQRFSLIEIMLHSLLALPLDRSELQPSLAALDRQQLRCIMLYLHKWFHILYGESVVPSKIESVEGIRRLPSMHNVISWVSTLLTLHMTTILSDTSLHQILREMQTSMKWLQKDTKLLMTTAGFCKEILRTKTDKLQSPSGYQIEVFDFSLTSL